MLDRFQQAVGEGFMNGPYAPKNPNHTPAYYWRVGSQGGVRRTLMKLWPYLGQVKRDQALDVLDRLNQYLDTPRGRWAA